MKEIFETLIRITVISLLIIGIGIFIGTIWLIIYSIVIGNWKLFILIFVILAVIIPIIVEIVYRIGNRP